MAPLLVPLSIGELIDKITILDIKTTLLDGEPLHHAARERTLLQEVLTASGLAVDPALQGQLREVNQQLWQIEDDIRDHERRRDFGASFIELARVVYVTNDRRSAIKREINERHGSEIVEVKSYQPYA